MKNKDNEYIKPFRGTSYQYTAKALAKSRIQRNANWFNDLMEKESNGIPLTRKEKDFAGWFMEALRISEVNG